MTFELRSHTADVAVDATGDTLGNVFAACADGMAAAMSEERPENGDRFAFEERANSREALLFDYLDRLIYERDVRGVLPVANEATVERVAADDPDGADESADTVEWVVEATARGVPLDEVHARDLKAVTYSEMDLSKLDQGGWHAYVVFDV